MDKIMKKIAERNVDTMIDVVGLEEAKVRILEMARSGDKLGNWMLKALNEKIKKEAL